MLRPKVKRDFLLANGLPSIHDSVPPIILIRTMPYNDQTHSSSNKFRVHCKKLQLFAPICHKAITFKPI